jgi:hypothetical protein
MFCNGMSASQVYSDYFLYNAGTQFTCFTSKKVQRLTQKAGAGVHTSVSRQLARQLVRQSSACQ